MSNAPKIRFYHGILFKVLLPDLATGILFSFFAVSILTDPMVTFLDDNFKANLRHISRDGIDICDNYFNYLMELRMEDDPEMNLSMQNEAMSEIVDIGRELKMVHMLVLKDGSVAASSLDGPVTVENDMKEGNIKLGMISRCRINGSSSLACVRYFPFWDYHIVSFIFQKDYQKPINAGKNIVFLGTLGVLAAILTVFLIVYNWFINRPLKKLVRHTEQVGKGNLESIPVRNRDEIGRLMTAYNGMVKSLEKERSEVTDLVDQLKQSESRFRNLFENVPTGICVMDEKGVVIASNDSMHKTFGHTRESIRFVSFDTLFFDPSESADLLARIRKEELIQNYETKFVCPDDTALMVELTLSAAKLKDQLLIIAIVENITQKRKLEIQLQHARKMEAVGTLAGGIAHDFNNILQAVKGYIAILLLDKSKDHQDIKSLKAVDNAADRAAQLVRQLLMFSRKLDTERRPLDINSCMEQAAGILERTIPKMISIEFNLEEKPWTVRADAIQLEQVVLNLGTNASDAMPSGGRITIETANVKINGRNMPENIWMDAGAYVKLVMTDTGEGMDKALVDHIFEPFFTTKEIGKGTGLGLASVYGIVKEHEGYIACTSEVGKGTSFMIFLPAEPAENEAAGIELEAKKTGAEEKTILVVDDEPAVLEVSRQGLDGYGFAVFTASSGEEALEVIAGADPPVDLVVLDISMPGMGGYRCLEEIRKLDDHVKVVISTGYSFDDSRGKPSPDSGGPDDFIQKPYNLDELVAKIRQVLAA
ncbi:MAG: response regulator [Desulfarculaceae bacterium]|nr:response regulator [Desulfarculaceae bacterium]